MRKQHAFPMVGASSLLVIFAVLCLTTFALLSLNTALAGSRLSQQSAQAVQAYYDADTNAEYILSQLRAGTMPDEVEQHGNIYSYCCPISEHLELQVTIRQDDDGSFSILQWQSVSTVNWQANENINVWNGTQ